MGRNSVNKLKNLSANPRSALPRRKLLVTALSFGVAFAGTAFAQSTTGNIFGQVPAASGETIVVKNASGVTREVAVGADGRYVVSNLSSGTYTVSLMRDGQVVNSRENVTIRVGSGTDVSFADAGSAKSLSAITVNANSLPSIDVSAVDSRTVITAEQLAKLPLARTAEAVALLAPGANQGSGYFTGPLGNSLVSFGGSSVTENAYYINGFNTTDPLSGFGGITLPYGAIDQEEVLTGGYDAAYGRSDGGVINMLGKRGTNEWHFGGQIQWTPNFAKSSQRNIYYPQNTSPSAGKMYQYRKNNKDWTTQVNAYAGGPLIKDKLFLFVAAEASRTEGQATTSNQSPFTYKRRYDDPKSYVKLDWNINDSNILEYTNVSNKRSYAASIYDFDYDTLSTGDFNSYDTSFKTAAKDNIFKYTGYITDDLTISALYGKQKITYYENTPGYDPTYPNINHPERQNPAITGGNVIVSPNAILTFNNPAHRSTNANFRFDVSYRLGDHTLSAGIDNQDTHDIDDGTSTSGPGYAWEYDKINPNDPISDQAGNAVDAPGNYPGGETGYYVAQYIYNTAASVRVKQKAQYIQDNWQVNDRVLVKIGLRNDQFTNYNPDSVPFLRLSNGQLAPRLGFSWDVMGDSTFKVYGNAGRYFLAMPASVALRAAGGSLFTRTYYTYTGIDANGIPTGLTPINTDRGPGQPISANNEYGQQPDPHSVAARNIGSEYQDEFVLGFDKQLNDSWTYGAKALVRKLRRGLDDICDPDTILNVAAAQGIDTSTITNVNGCYLSNPGRTNVYALPNTSGGYYNVAVTAKDFGMADFKRNYYSMNLYLEHPFDGKWQGRVDYVYSKSYGNSEGQVRSDIGQTDVSATVDWDYGVFSDYANGLLANDHTHQLKAYGSYQVNPELLLGAVMRVSSGAPKSCLGYYGPYGTNPTGYGAYYHFCDGKPSRPGDAGRNPWTKTLDLNAEYRPAFADHKLAFNVYVFNVFNEQERTQTYPRYGKAGKVLDSYGRAVTTETPRYVRFGVSYDF
ncbi:MAG: TonB-dependent receptor [Dyella sp.]|uniref:TonB-dependent receptor n=1 Tax=Dyella sp. TaxID=1869338 RepID=UPI003F7D08C6